MNATSLFVSTSRLVLQADINDPSTFMDLYRLVPYLRQSLSCTVCGNLLIEPHTPTETNCQHHVCRSCKGGRKKLKPSCSWCKNYDKYIENVQLRILLQCYKKLCEYVTSTSIFAMLGINSVGCTNTSHTSSLKDLIREGAGFKDDYKSTGGLSKSAYSILPCIYTSTSTQTNTALATSNILSMEPNNYCSSNDVQDYHTPDSSMYSVMYPGHGSKITIKRKASDYEVDAFNSSGSGDSSLPLISSPKKPPIPRSVGPKLSSLGSKGGLNAGKRKGCRCGNATPTPGKLTCCGQRCPCYVESKACMECRCRGCRNPHRPGGHKVRPLIPEFQNYQLHLGNNHSSVLAMGDPTLTTLDQPGLTMEPSDISVDYTHLGDLHDSGSLQYGNGSKVQVLGVYTAQFHNMSSTLPTALLVDDDTDNSADEMSDIEIVDI
uniref:E3 ubiquitin-protein ligase MSL2 n=1 Tax=Timema californicum TaxID=61474 RepID=A0A7R9P443_TIMCA|nr:unnamed protein product [Timema californicum]